MAKRDGRRRKNRLPPRSGRRPAKQPPPSTPYHTFTYTGVPTELDWVQSKRVGQVSEIAVLAPIKKGRVPGERRTYEERCQAAIANLEGRVQAGLPTELDPIATIHFGRMFIIRPEQYLVDSKVPGLCYYPSSRIPKPIDDYNYADTVPDPKTPEFRSWLLTLVEFDGDIGVYFRDVAQFLVNFDVIFQNCENFPGTKRFEHFWTWIKRYQIESSLFAPRYPELSVVRIKQLENFKRRFDAFVAKVRSPTGPRVKSMDELFDEFLTSTQQYASGFPSPSGIYKVGDDGGGQ
jgi:hypothetical protein